MEQFHVLNSHKKIPVLYHYSQVVKLYEVMGKPLPEIKDAPVGVGDITAMGTHIQKTGRPLINFVKSSKELRMRGEDDEEETPMNVDAEETGDQGSIN